VSKEPRMEWQDVETCPVNEYVLFGFDGPFQNRECPGVAVGKLYSDGTIWLTAIWAASSAHDDPVKWMRLPAWGSAQP
jgi:hypothetical protein